MFYYYLGEGEGVGEFYVRFKIKILYLRLNGYKWGV